MFRASPPSQVRCDTDKMHVLVPTTNSKPGKESIMSKGQNGKRNSKKEPAKTMKEKKAAKRAKKNEKMIQGGLFIQPPTT